MRSLILWISTALALNAPTGPDRAGPDRVRLDLPGVASACRRGACEHAVDATLRRLRREHLSEDAWNDQIGGIALALFVSARDSHDRRARSRAATALVGLASFSTEPDQKAAFLTVARAMRKGDAALWSMDNPFSASPS